MIRLRAFFYVESVQIEGRKEPEIYYNMVCEPNRTSVLSKNKEILRYNGCISLKTTDENIIKEEIKKIKIRKDISSIVMDVPKELPLREVKIIKDHSGENKVIISRWGYNNY